MSADRSTDYLRHMREAAQRAVSFVEGFDENRFLADDRTQQAVVMSILIIGEAATKILDRHPDIVAQMPEVPWLAMRGMRNRIAHGYFAMDMRIVWSTARETLPDLIQTLDDRKTRER